MIRFPLEALMAAPEELEKLLRFFTGGGVWAIPTDTFYGLAANPTSEAGVARIFAAKGRDDGKPLPVLVAYPEQLEALGVAAPTETIARLRGIWPAPLTAVLPLRAPIAASRGGLTLAVRIPADERVRWLLAETGPRTATSANRSGRPPAIEPSDVEAELGDHLDVLVDGGSCPGGLPSTIVDFTVDPPSLRRAGAYPWPPGANPAR